MNFMVGSYFQVAMWWILIMWQILGVSQNCIAERSLATTYAGHLAWTRQPDVVVMQVKPVLHGFYSNIVKENLSLLANM